MKNHTKFLLPETWNARNLPEDTVIQFLHQVEFTQLIAMPGNDGRRQQ